jgi:hypothetical protein
MSAKKGRLEGQIYISSNWQATCTDSVGAQTVTVAAGNWYILDLIAEMNTDLIRNWLVTIDDGEGGTGRVTITTSDVNFSVAFLSDDFRELLGFTGDIVAASSAQTGTNSAKGIWCPDVVKWSPHGDEDGGGDIGVLVTDKTQTVSGAGHVKTLVSSERREIRGIRWQGLGQSKTRTRYETYTNESFEQFWRDTQNGNTVDYFVAGSPMRFYPDAGSDSVYSVVKMVGLSEFDPSTFVPNWVGRYDLQIPNMIKVPS